MFTWVGLFLTQVALIVWHRPLWHRRLGVIGMGVAALVVALAARRCGPASSVRCSPELCIAKTDHEGHNTGTFEHAGLSSMAHAGQDHWDAVYEKKRADEVSWYEPRPGKSLELIQATGIQVTEPVIDVGGGASLLVDELLAAGYSDLTVLDVSAAVLEKLRSRLGSAAASVRLLHEDVTAFRPTRQFALWHDRAVFHFLTQHEDRQRYIDALQQGVRPGGHVLMATFGPAGPERCSGLPTVRYDAATLGVELGAEFALVESSLVIHRTPWNANQQFLYCRFNRRP